MTVRYECPRCKRMIASTGPIYGRVGGSPYVYLRDHGPQGAGLTRCVGVTVTIATKLTRATAAGAGPRSLSAAGNRPAPTGGATDRPSARSVQAPPTSGRVRP